MLKDNARIDLTRRRIINELNRASLPIYVLEYIVGDVYQELQRQRVEQVKKEEQEYEEEVKAEKRKGLPDAEQPTPGEALPPKGEIPSHRGTMKLPLSEVKVKPKEETDEKHISES